MKSTPEYGLQYPEGPDRLETYPSLAQHNAFALEAALQELKFLQTDKVLTGAEDLLALAAGWHRVEAAGAESLGLPKTTAFDPPLQIGGFLLSLNRGTTRTLVWVTGHNRPQLWLNHANVNGFQGWQVVGGAKGYTELIVKNILTAPQVDALSKRSDSGFYAVSGIGGNQTTATPPTNFNQVMLHLAQADSGSQAQIAMAAHATDAGLYYRGETAGGSRTWHQWQRVMAEEQSPALNRSSLMREDLREQWGGRIYTGAAVPVALTWDDFPRDFRDHILPMLVARGLPSTVALSSKMYDAALAPGIAPGSTGTTWAEINAWPDDITIANHSATHTSATDRYSMYQEIVQSRIDLQNSLPDKNILTWVQPSVTYDPRFNNGDSAEAYARTIAGHMILGNHAFATGARRVNGDSGCYMDNQPMQGMARNWIDSGNGIANTKAIISGMRSKRRGIIVGAHADRYFRGTGYPTLSELEAFLDWLVAEQYAGRVRVLNLEQFSIARYGLPPESESAAPVVLRSESSQSSWALFTTDDDRATINNGMFNGSVVYLPAGPWLIEGISSITNTIQHYAGSGSLKNGYPVSSAGSANRFAITVASGDYLRVICATTAATPMRINAYPL